MSYDVRTGLFAHQAEMIEKINKIGNIPQIKIISADFDNDRITVMTEALYNKKLVGLQPTFEEVMASVEFFRISENFSIKHVNFLTGEILTQWFENENQKIVFGELTQEELDLLSKNQKINAIKKVRERTGLGLLDAKNMVEKAALAWSLRGNIPRW